VFIVALALIAGLASLAMTGIAGVIFPCGRKAASSRRMA
jgi:hypothetical protein